MHAGGLRRKIKLCWPLKFPIRQVLNSSKSFCNFQRCYNTHNKHRNFGKSFISDHNLCNQIKTYIKLFKITVQLPIISEHKKTMYTSSVHMPKTFLEATI